jgi:hypothetical protein
MAEEHGTKNEGISDSDKLGALVDMIKDACAKLDSVAARQDAADRRLDSMEADRKDAFKKDAVKKDAVKKDAVKKDAVKKDDDEEIERPGEAREPAADKRKDAEDEDEKRDADDFDTLKAARGDVDEDEKREDEKREDADDYDDDDEERMADFSFISRAEAAQLQAQIKALQTQIPAILTTADRERFAAVQEQADVAFQAFGDRAPAPLQGETVTAYKRRLGAKMQKHSKRWSAVRLSAVSDEVMLDTVLADVFADAVSAAAAGEGVPEGMLREKVTHSGGHTIVEFHGSPDTWMNAFAGVSQRATGSWAKH